MDRSRIKRHQRGWFDAEQIQIHVQPIPRNRNLPFKFDIACVSTKEISSLKGAKCAGENKDDCNELPDSFNALVCNDI